MNQEEHNTRFLPRTSSRNYGNYTRQPSTQLTRTTSVSYNPDFEKRDIEIDNKPAFVYKKVTTAAQQPFQEPASDEPITQKPSRPKKEHRIPNKNEKYIPYQAKISDTLEKILTVSERIDQNLTAIKDMYDEDRAYEEMMEQQEEARRKAQEEEEMNDVWEVPQPPNGG